MILAICFGTLSAKHNSPLLFCIKIASGSNSHEYKVIPYIKGGMHYPMRKHKKSKNYQVCPICSRRKERESPQHKHAP